MHGIKYNTLDKQNMYIEPNDIIKISSGNKK